MKNQEFEYREHPNLSGEVRKIKLTVSIFDSIEEAVEFLGKEESLRRINKSILDKAKSDWNNLYCKELRNEK